MRENDCYDKRKRSGRQRRQQKLHRMQWLKACQFTILLGSACSVDALHHMKQPAVHMVNRRDTDRPLTVTNQCIDTIYPAVFTQSGVGPQQGGFRLDPGATLAQTVSADWQGRVWGRTNCTFDANGTASGQQGSACDTGDCGQNIVCQGVGNPPATLAEFTLTSPSGQTFFDISLVDGYNLAMGVIMDPGDNPAMADVPPNMVNPVCIGTAALLQPAASAVDVDFGSNSTYPLPLEQSLSTQAVSKWCPWPLQLNPPYRPGDGVYPYPDSNIARPPFNPCLSACAKFNEDQYCCSGKYDSPAKCKPSYYSTQAKLVCPDAYSYAFDDSTSTFIMKEGAGFKVVFCPDGRSTNILKTFGNQVRQMAATGVTQEIESLARNKTYIAEKSDSMLTEPSGSVAALVVLLIWLCLL